MPASIAVAIASSTVASASTATMSVRGSITSRTTVSPNSKMEWMSSRSSVSMESSCAATSAIVRMSASVVNGPERSPLPGSTTLANPMNNRVNSRSGRKPVTETSSGEMKRAVRSLCCSAKVFGTTSNNVNTTKISTKMPSPIPSAPSDGSRTVPRMVAPTIWHPSTNNRMLLSVCSGCSSRRSTRCARLSPSSSSATSRMRLTRVNAVSASASTPEKAQRKTTTTITTAFTGAPS